MRIVYGVQMQGQGHTNRAAVMIRRLRARGHRVDVVTSGPPPPPYARALWGDFDHTPAPTFAIEDGRLRLGASLALLRRAVPVLLRAVDALAARLVRERIDLVVTDFEPVTAWAARRAGVPAAGAAGQYRMTHTDAAHPDGALERELARAFIRFVTPGLARTFAVSFTPLVPTRPRTTVVGPVVADEVRAATPHAGEHVLVYSYARPVASVIDALPGPTPYRVYGLGGPARHGHVELCATDRARFVDDLIGCRAVIGGGSFQLACEAAVLGKPLLSIPFAGQYEERFSAHQIARAGLGLTAPALDRAAVGRLLAHPPPVPDARDGAAAIVGALGL